VRNSASFVYLDGPLLSRGSRFVTNYEPHML